MLSSRNTRVRTLKGSCSLQRVCSSGVGDFVFFFLGGGEGAWGGDGFYIWSTKFNLLESSY